MDNFNERTNFLWNVANLIDDHVKFYKKFADDPDFQDFFVEAMFQRYMESQGSRPGQ